jgi:glycosyltransferase involved in cell wall biosynthesis
VNPDGGGVVEALKQFSLAHRDLGHTVEVLSLDEPDAPWVKAFPLRVHALGPANGKYGYAPALVPWLKEHRKNYDAVIIDGLWQYNVFGVWRALHGTDTPYFVFPHGMLDPWFKHTYPLKHLKKWLYWPWAEYRVLRDATRVFFTCEEEKRLARESFWLYRVNEEVASLGLQAAPGDAAQQRALFQEKFPALRGKRVLLFLARLHVKKGCDLLIEAFAESARKDPQLHLVMAGPDQTGWQATLQQRCAELGIADRVTWTGMISGDLKWGAIRSAEVFILPSHQENFGLAVVEALACGVPVLISDKVNIWREIEADGAGVVATDTLEGTRQLIERWREMKPDALATMQANATASFARRFEIGTAAKHLLARLRAAGVRDAVSAPQPVTA